MTEREDEQPSGRRVDQTSYVLSMGWGCEIF